MSIQLEVGKTYVTRDGRHYLVKQGGRDGAYRFRGKCVYVPDGNPGFVGERDVFTEDGRYHCTPVTSHYDLIAEARTEGAVDKATPSPDVLDAAALTVGVEAEPPSRGLFGALDVLLNRKEGSDRSTAPVNAEGFLRDAASTMAERGKQYDSPEGERSMGKTVQAFNTITGQDLTEAQGWLFMSVLKKVRQYQAGAHLDSCVDDVAYTALFAEARMQEKQS